MAEKDREIELCTNIDQGKKIKVGFREIDGIPHIIHPGLPPLPALPRENVMMMLKLTKPLFAEYINRAYPRVRHLCVKYDKLCPQVKLIHDAFDKLINWEQPWDKFHIKLWGNLRDIVCLILNEDLPYRWRAIALFEELSKVALSEADKAWIKNQVDWNYKSGDDGPPQP